MVNLFYFFLFFLNVMLTSKQRKKTEPDGSVEGEDECDEDVMMKSPAPGHDAASAVRRGVGHVQAIHFAQLGTCAFAGFGNILRHVVQVIQSGLAGKQHGGFGVCADGWTDDMSGNIMQ